MKDNLGGKIIREFVELRAKPYSYLKNNYAENKKPKSTKKCAIKRKPKYQDYKDYSEATQIERKVNYLRKKIDLNSPKEDQK